MSRYRYSNHNGQFLPTKFQAPLLEIDWQYSPQTWTVTNESGIKGNDNFDQRIFRKEQGYNLRMEFVSGTSSASDSYTTKGKLSSYSPSKLIGWWRLNDYDLKKYTYGSDLSGDGVPNIIHSGESFAGSLALDYSGNSLNAVQTDDDKKPTDSSSSPSKFITTQEKSLEFTYTGASSTRDGLEIEATSELNFGNGSSDRPFSISAWIKITSNTGKVQIVVSRWSNISGASDSEWFFGINTSMQLEFALYDQSRTFTTTTSRRGRKSDVLSQDVWYHVAATYDGRGGNLAHLGCNIYIDGVVNNADNVFTDSLAGSYVAMEDLGQPVGIGAIPASIGNSLSCFSGNLSDIAIWSRELSASEIAHLYGVKQNGAYRLVRDYSKVSQGNDTRVLGIATKKMGFDTTSWSADILDQYVQGINVKSFDQLLNYNLTRIRPNSGFVKTLRGKDLPRTAFNETIATTALSSGSNVSHVSIGGNGRLSERITHEREYRDLGQSVIYDNGGVFEDTLDLDPVALVTKFPEDLVLPYQLVAQTSDELTDGAIEPLTLREIIDGSSIEGPFYSHVFRASLGGMTDAFRRSYVIVDGHNLKEMSVDLGTAPYLDSVENLGNINMPGAFSEDFGVIEPYVDYLNDRDKEYTTNSVSTTISNMLIHSSSWTDSDDRHYDKVASHGFVFDNDPIGFDSIAFGGLKK